MHQPRLADRLTPRRSAPFITLVVLSLLFIPVFTSPVAEAQDVPQRQIRAYIPPDQLVSFHPSTPFSDFLNEVNPLFQEYVGVRVVDPFSLNETIGISISGMHFMDALELVLEYKGLSYRETDQYLIIEEAQPEPDLFLDGQGRPTQAAQAVQEAIANINDREIQINAVLFELNQTRARQLGIDWNVLFGEGTGTGGTGRQQGDFALQTGDLFEGLRRLYIEPPEQLMFSQLTQMFRLLETEGLGETIAQPSVTVRSADQGRIQIGSDIPVQVRDFAGNTITQFVQTGIIVDVTPTLLTQPIDNTPEAPTLDFIHMDVQVERSSGRPFGGSIAVDRSTANTRVMLLDGEQTIIGGLYSTDVSRTRRGIPLLKDLPGWFFGLRYVFGFEQNELTQRELVIVLHAQVRDHLTNRADRPFDVDLLEERRRQVQQNLMRFDEATGRTVRNIERQLPQDEPNDDN